MDLDLLTDGLKKRGRGYYDKDSPLIIAWLSRTGEVVLQVWRSFTKDTIKVAAMKAIKLGSKIYSDSAKSYQVLSLLGYTHQYARGEVHENRAEVLFSLLKPYLLAFSSFKQGAVACIRGGIRPKDRLPSKERVICLDIHLTGFDG